MPHDAEHLSIIIPVYRSHDILPRLHRRLKNVLDSIPESYEIIFVNDCSPDRSWQVIKDVSETNPNVKAIFLRKNMGYDNALMAGLNFSTGTHIVTMDDDLQHAPEDIPKLLSEIRKGYDVVYAHFIKKRQSLIKNLGSWLNGKVAEIVFKKPKAIYLSPFKIFRKEIAEEIIKYKGPYPYVDGIIFLATTSITQIPISHHKRAKGKGNHNLRRSIRIWSNAATGFSTFPLRILSYIGLSISLLSGIFVIYLVLWRLLYGITPEGWASIILGISFFSGIQLSCLGLIGEYLGRVYLSINAHPQFVTKEKIRL